jgi:hypothetical protein
MSVAKKLWVGAAGGGVVVVVVIGTAAVVDTALLVHPHQ